MEEMNFSEIKEIEDKYQLKTYSKFPISVERGEGVYVVDSEGKRYLDFYAGHAVALTGHCHPKVVAAIQAQASKLIFYSNIVYNSERALTSKILISLLPEAFTEVFFCNSGSEANETALKMARKFTGRSHIISMHEGFHGRTFGSLSVTGFDKYKIFPPHLPEISFAKFGELESLEACFKAKAGQVAAVILEPIQSMAGVKIAAPSYFEGMRKLCDQHGALLIFDEVQTGFGRTGQNFFAQTVGVNPDLISTAKSIASGVPMGALFVQKHIASQVKLGEQGSTFGGSPLACAASRATAGVIVEEKLCARAKDLGTYLIDNIKQAALPAVKEVRGVGLLIGIEFEKPAKELIGKLLQRGVIIGSSEKAETLRLIPPLVINKTDCDIFLQHFVDAVRGFFV